MVWNIILPEDRTLRPDRIFRIHLFQPDPNAWLWARTGKGSCHIREVEGYGKECNPHQNAGIYPPWAIWRYALRRCYLQRTMLITPISQDMGRSLKSAFSFQWLKSPAISTLHWPLVLMPRVTKEGAAIADWGFKVLLGRGLGSQPLIGDVVMSSLPTD